MNSCLINFKKIKELEDVAKHLLQVQQITNFGVDIID